MPFVSAKQRRYLYSEKPKVAKKFAEHSKNSGNSKSSSKSKSSNVLKEVYKI